MISEFGPHGAHFVLFFFFLFVSSGLSLLWCFDVAWFLIALRQDMHSTHSDGRWTRLCVRSPAFGSSV